MPWHGLLVEMQHVEYGTRFEHCFAFCGLFLLQAVHVVQYAIGAACVSCCLYCSSLCFSHRIVSITTCGVVLLCICRFSRQGDAAFSQNPFDCITLITACNWRPFGSQGRIRFASFVARCFFCSMNRFNEISRKLFSRK